MTPGCFNACEKSRRLIRAWAYGLLKNATCARRGKRRSSMNAPRPCSRRCAFGRGTLWPMSPPPGCVPGACSGSSAFPIAHLGLHYVLYRVDDRLISRAAAVIACNVQPDFLACDLSLSTEEVLRGHQHAGRAETALQRVALVERLL